MIRKFFKLFEPLGRAIKDANIVQSIKKLIRRHKIAELKKFKGTVDLELDLDAARDRNENYSSFSGGDHEISES